MDQRFEEQNRIFINRYDDYIFHEGLFAAISIMRPPVKKRHVYYELS